MLQIFKLGSAARPPQLNAQWCKTFGLNVNVIGSHSYRCSICRYRCPRSPI